MLLGLAASASWALANVVVQRAGRSAGAVPALFWALLCGVAISASGSAAFDPRGLPFSPAAAGWLAVAGVAGLTAYACLFYAFEHGRLTLAVPIMSSWAALASGLSLAMFDERLSAPQLGGGAAVVVGAMVVARFSQGAPGTEAAPAGARIPRWLLASFGAALGFGVLIPVIRKLSPVFGELRTISVVYAADILLGLPLGRLYRIPLGPPRGRQWWPVVLAGLFETAGFACITFGGRLAPLAVVSPLASLAAALTILYAWIVLGDRPARGVMVGAALVCAGVVALAL